VRCLTRITLYTEVDAHCDKLVNGVGQTSTVASTVNLVLPTTIANVHHCQTKMTTRCDDRRAGQNFKSPEFWDKRKYPYFLATPEFPYNTRWIGRRKHPCQKPGRPFNTFDRIPTCDRQTNTADRHWHIRVVHGSILCDPIQPNPSADWPNPTQPNTTNKFNYLMQPELI